MSTSFDTSGFVESLKQLTIGSLHKDIDRIHADFNQQAGFDQGAISKALGELNNVCGETVVRRALQVTESPPSQMIYPKPMDLSREPDFGDANGPPEISQGALDAWNHALSCPLFLSDRKKMNLLKTKKAINGNELCSGETCTFPLCDQVRPSVLHRVDTKRKGIVDKCLEGCKECGFYLKMKKATADSHADPKFHKFQRKRLQLNQKFAGLLLAHKTGQGDQEMLNLYNHVMNCQHVVKTCDEAMQTGLRSDCTFRNAHGSCQTAMQLFAHYQTCRLIKECVVCSALPPKLRRIKKTRSAIPVPLALKQLSKKATKRKRKETQADQLSPEQDVAFDIDLDFDTNFHEPEPTDVVEKTRIKRRIVQEDEGFGNFFGDDPFLDSKAFVKCGLDGFLGEV